MAFRSQYRRPKRKWFNDNLLVRINFIIVTIRWTGLVPWDFGFPFPGSLTSTCLATSIISAGHPLNLHQGSAGYGLVDWGSGGESRPKILLDLTDGGRERERQRERERRVPSDAQA